MKYLHREPIKQNQEVSLVSTMTRGEETSWLEKCALGEVKHISLLSKLSDFILGAGFHHSNIKYIGGLRVLLESPSFETRDKLVSKEAAQIAYWFTWINPWNLKTEESRPGRVI